MQEWLHVRFSFYATAAARAPTPLPSRESTRVATRRPRVLVLLKEYTSTPIASAGIDAIDAIMTEHRDKICIIAAYELGRRDDVRAHFAMFQRQHGFTAT